jgi:hypothetical protein
MGGEVGGGISRLVRSKEWQKGGGVAVGDVS